MKNVLRIFSLFTIDLKRSMIKGTIITLSQGATLMKIHARLALLCALCLLSGCALQPDVPTASSGSLSQQEDTQTQTVIDATSLLSADTGLLDNYLRDSVTMSASSDGGTFDPYSHSSLLATNLIFQSLVRLDNQGNIRYELARSVEQVDELHYTITLWDGIHDSEGNPLTTSDVVFSIELLQQTGNGSQVNKLDHLEIV
jgi:ABC-type transport system substrate-binding protein